MKIEVFATIMALYPTTRTEDIAEEFGIPTRTIHNLAVRHHVRKTRELRSQINRDNGAKGSVYYRDHLTRFQQEVLRMRHLGLLNEEIAARLGRTPGAISSCIHNLKVKKQID